MFGSPAAKTPLKRKPNAFGTPLAAAAAPSSSSTTTTATSTASSVIAAASVASAAAAAAATPASASKRRTFVASQDASLLELTLPTALRDAASAHAADAKRLATVDGGVALLATASGGSGGGGGVAAWRVAGGGACHLLDVARDESVVDACCCFAEDVVDDESNSQNGVDAGVGVVVALESGALLFWRDWREPQTPPQRVSLPSDAGRPTLVMRLARTGDVVVDRRRTRIIVVATDRGRLLALDVIEQRSATDALPRRSLALRQSSASTSSSSTTTNASSSSSTVNRGGLLSSLGAMLWRSTPTPAPVPTPALVDDAQCSGGAAIRHAVQLDDQRLLSITTDAAQVWRIEPRDEIDDDDADDDVTVDVDGSRAALPVLVVQSSLGTTISASLGGSSNELRSTLIALARRDARSVVALCRCAPRREHDARPIDELPVVSMALIELSIDNNALPVTVSRCALLTLPSTVSLPPTFVVHQQPDDEDDDDDNDDDDDDMNSVRLSDDWPRLVLGGDGTAYVAWRTSVVAVHFDRALKAARDDFSARRCSALLLPTPLTAIGLCEDEIRQRASPVVIFNKSSAYVVALPNSSSTTNTKASTTTPRASQSSFSSSSSSMTLSSSSSSISSSMTSSSSTTHSSLNDASSLGAALLDVVSKQQFDATRSTREVARLLQRAHASSTTLSRACLRALRLLLDARPALAPQWADASRGGDRIAGLLAAQLEHKQTQADALLRVLRPHVAASARRRLTRLTSTLRAARALRQLQNSQQTSSALACLSRAVSSAVALERDADDVDGDALRAFSDQELFYHRVSAVPRVVAALCQLGTTLITARRVGAAHADIQLQSCNAALAVVVRALTPGAVRSFKLCLALEQHCAQFAALLQQLDADASVALWQQLADLVDLVLCVRGARRYDDDASDVDIDEDVDDNDNDDDDNDDEDNSVGRDRVLDETTFEALRSRLLAPFCTTLGSDASRDALLRRLAERHAAFDVLAALCERAQDDGSMMRQFVAQFGVEFERVAFARCAQDPSLRVRLFQQPPTRRVAVQQCLSEFPAVAWLEHVRYGEFDDAARNLLLTAVNERRERERARTCFALARLSARAARVNDDVACAGLRFLLIGDALLDERRTHVCIDVGATSLDEDADDDDDDGGRIDEFLARNDAVDKDGDVDRNNDASAADNGDDDELLDELKRDAVRLLDDDQQLLTPLGVALAALVGIAPSFVRARRALDVLRHARLLATCSSSSSMNVALADATRIERAAWRTALRDTAWLRVGRGWSRGALNDADVARITRRSATRRLCALHAPPPRADALELALGRATLSRATDDEGIACAMRLVDAALAVE